MKHNKNLEQRTFLQDRFEILIKKQKTGQATFSELTELDDIVNKYTAIREKILEEMQGPGLPPDGPTENEKVPLISKEVPVSILDTIRSLFGRVFNTKMTNLLSPALMKKGLAFYF